MHDAALEQILAGLCAFAESRADILALALIGSHARGKARAASDIDILLLAEDPAALFREGGWHRAALGERLAGVADHDYGLVRSRHVLLTDGREIELSVAPLSWACVSPLDPGTEEVLRGGLRPLYDPQGHLARLVSADRGPAR